MLVSATLLLIITAGGFGLSYLISRDAPMLWRIAFGIVAGSAVFGTVLFAVSFLTGFGAAATVISLGVTLLPLILFNQKDFRRRVLADWRKAKGKLQGANRKKIFRFVYYAFFFLMFWLFFQQAMYETPRGIFTGASQNLGDLPFHLGTIFGFTDGNNFPPQNPSFAGAKFSYPFIADLITAGFMKLGAGIEDALFVQNVAWAFSLLVILERFALKLTRDAFAAKIVPVLLFFSGGLGVFAFLSDYWHQTASFFQYLQHLPFDYTIGDKFRWGNSLVVLFITQRSFLLGAPLTIFVLTFLWKIFSNEAESPAGGFLNEAGTTKQHEITRKDQDSKNPRSAFPIPQSALLIGFLAGTLPLIHLHSLAVLFIVTACLFIAKPDKWRDWVSFGVGVCIVGVPELAWALTGTASRTSEFFSWWWGWNKGDTDFFWFWFINTGITIPVIIAGILYLYSPRRRKDASSDENTRAQDLLLFYIPFLFCFILCNTARLAPWEWDNIKILIYWFIGSLPFMAIFLAWMWRENATLRIVSIVCLIVLTSSGALDVWRTVSGQTKIQIFERKAVLAADQIKAKTEPGSIFLNAPTYNTAIALTGRNSVMRYSGHLGSHGIDYRQRDADVKSIYAGTRDADKLLSEYNVGYVLISPEEKAMMPVNEDFFKKFPVVVESGDYRVYKTEQ
jgi:hypothetical protein